MFGSVARRFDMFAIWFNELQSRPDQDRALGIWTFVICPILVYWRHITSLQLTGWDTFDYQFPKFLYAIDTIAIGQWPFWNPFQNAGDFFLSPAILPLSPIYFPFLIVGQFLNPVLVFELATLSIILVANLGFLKALDQVGVKDRLQQAVLVAIFSVMIVGPLLGQVSFIFSIANFLWMFIALHKLNSKSEVKAADALLYGAGCAFLAIPGYIVLNFIFGLIIAAIVLLKLIERSDRKSILIVNSIVFAIPFLSLSVISILPIIENTKEYYSWFAGDLRSPDPRVRFFPPKADEPMLQFKSWMTALNAVFDVNLEHPKITSWALGMGIGVLAFFISFIATGKAAVEFIRQRPITWVWLGVSLFLLLTSLGRDSLVWQIFVSNTPILNNNRFPVIHVIVVQLCLLFLIAEALKDEVLFRKPSPGKVVLILVLLLSLGAAIWGRSPMWLAVTLLFFGICKQTGVQKAEGLFKTKLLLLLLIGTVFSKLVLGWHDLKMQPVDQLWGQVANRKKIPEYHLNTRNKGILDSDYYRQDPESPDYRDLRWVIDKVPYARGYNLFNHPLHAKMKTSENIEKIFYLSNDLNEVDPPNRKSESSDNAMLSNLHQSVEAAVSKGAVIVDKNLGLLKPNFNSTGKPAVIESISITPHRSTVTVTSTQPAYLVNMTKFYPGWAATIDGAPTPLHRANYIYTAVQVPSGRHTIEYLFTPSAVHKLTLLPHAVFLLFLIVVAFHTFRRTDRN
jgi:hypothetical protein